MGLINYLQDEEERVNRRVGQQVGRYNRAANSIRKEVEPYQNTVEGYNQRLKEYNATRYEIDGGGQAYFDRVTPVTLDGQLATHAYGAYRLADDGTASALGATKATTSIPSGFDYPNVQGRVLSNGLIGTPVDMHSNLRNDWTVATHLTPTKSGVWLDQVNDEGDRMLRKGSEIVAIQTSDGGYRIPEPVERANARYDAAIKEYRDSVWNSQPGVPRKYISPPKFSTQTVDVFDASAKYENDDSPQSVSYRILEWMKPKATEADEKLTAAKDRLDDVSGQKQKVEKFANRETERLQTEIDLNRRRAIEEEAMSRQPNAGSVLDQNMAGVFTSISDWLKG